MPFPGPHGPLLERSFPGTYRWMSPRVVSILIVFGTLDPWSCMLTLSFVSCGLFSHPPAFLFASQLSHHICLLKPVAAVATLSGWNLGPWPLCLFLCTGGGGGKPRGLDISVSGLCVFRAILFPRGKPAQGKKLFLPWWL